MRILIIGGTKFIGRAVVNQLARAGHTLAVFHRGQTQNELPRGVREIIGDRKQLDAHADAFKQFAPDVVLDMIPFLEADAHALMQTFRGRVARLAVISSIDVYRNYGGLLGIESGEPEAALLTEDSPLRTRLYPYRGETPRAPDDPRRWFDDYDKILVERVVMNDPALSATVLRLPMVYGPRDGQHRTFEYLKRMDDQRPAIFLEEGAAHWRTARGFVEDIAHGIALALTNERARGRVYNIAEARALTELEWVQHIARVADWRGRVIVAPREKISPSLRFDGDARYHLAADSTRIRNELGYSEIVPLDDALKQTIEWERSNPPAQIDPKQFDYAAEDAALAQLG